MSAIYPLILFFATGFVWIVTARNGNRLIETFWQRLPHVAQRELDSVIGRSIRNGLFPFRRRAAEVLRGDEVLWRLRRRFLFWAMLSLLVPVLGFLSIGVYAFFDSQQ
jgi:hypothetical protein